MNVDEPISTTPQDIIVSISKTNGQTLTTTKTFQVKRDFTADEDILAVNKILNSLTPGQKLIRVPKNLSGSIINNPINKNTIERKVRELIDPSNTSGDPNHSSLRQTKITLTKILYEGSDSIDYLPKKIEITISKNDGDSITFSEFVVFKDSELKK